MAGPAEQDHRSLAAVLSALEARGATRRLELTGSSRSTPPPDSADVCVIGEIPADSVRETLRIARRALGDRGAIVCGDKDAMLRDARSFFRALPRNSRIYPLMHEILVVEIGIPTLLSDASVRDRVPRAGWLAADRFRVAPTALRLAYTARAARNSALGRWLRLLPGGLLAKLPARRPPVHFAVCAIFRDEARYLEEWLAFHRLQGVEQFWLYDNHSADDWRDAIRQNAEIVNVVSWTDVPGQISAYQDCIVRHRRDARWIAFLDLDEFLFSPTGRPVADVLREFERHPAVVANWRMYGTSGHDAPPEGLVIENYTSRGADNHPDNRWVKAIIDPRKTIPIVDGPHAFRHHGVAVGEDHRPTEGGRRDPPTADLLRINHYFTRSASEYRRKRRRPSVADGIVRDTAQPPDGVMRDELILQFLPALKRVLGGDT